MVTKVKKEMIDGLQAAIDAAVGEALGFDISDYYSKAETDDALASKANAAATTAALAGKADAAATTAALAGKADAAATTAALAGKADAAATTAALAGKADLAVARRIALKYSLLT